LAKIKPEAEFRVGRVNFYFQGARLFFIFYFTRTVLYYRSDMDKVVLIPYPIEIGDRIEIGWTRNGTKPIE